MEPPDSLLTEPHGLISDVRQPVAQAAYAVLTMSYWQIGKRFNNELLREKCTDYGNRIVASVR